jgi:hypothetical protein
MFHGRGYGVLIAVDRLEGGPAFSSDDQRQLEAYAFSQIGAVMLWGAIASFIGAICMAALVGLGFWHARRTEIDERLLALEVVGVS